MAPAAESPTLAPGAKVFYVSLGAEADATLATSRDRVLARLKETGDVRLLGSSETAAIYEVTPRDTP